MAWVIYLVDFGFRRIMPKIAGLQKVYFSLTKGKGRLISRAELLGRLSFCGFEIVDIYKFRTMHLYSEFLQQYVYDRQGLLRIPVEERCEPEGRSRPF